MQNGFWLDISRTRLGGAGWFSAFLLFAAVASASSTYDLNADFGDGSGTNNPNGQWSLRYGSDLLPLHSWLGSESAWLWDWSGSTVPSFAFETMTKWNDCLPGDIVMQGVDSAGAPHANIRWNAPRNGRINISGRTWDAFGGRSGAWTLYVGDQNVAGGSIAGSSTRTSAGVTFAEHVLVGQSITNVSLVAGTQIVFNQDYGTAGVEMTISYEEAPPTETNVVITSFHGNGQLTWINSDTNLFYRIEWAPSLGDTSLWNASYSALLDLQSPNATVTAPVPMFYRVVGSSSRVFFPAPVPKSGQAASSYMAGDDGTYTNGLAWPNPRFTVGTGVDGTNCVTDNLTGLIWARNANMAGLMTWANAIVYCEALTYGGHTDWRLPNRRELLSLIDDSQNGPALCNTAGTGQWTENDPFTGVPQDFSWSSTSVKNLPWQYAWRVYLPFGDVMEALKSTATSYVWPVRGGQ